MKGWTEERIALAVKLWAEGKTAAAIAEAIGWGMTRNAVIGMLNRRKLKINGKKAGPGRVSKLVLGARAPKPHAPAKRQLPAIRPAREETIFIPRCVVPARPSRPASQCAISKNEASPEAAERVLALKPGQCRYPLGDPLDPAFRFCAAPIKAEGKPYCAAHHRLCHRPSPFAGEGGREAAG
jgi:GcrA cell cycle regulator